MSRRRRRAPLTPAMNKNQRKRAKKTDIKKKMGALVTQMGPVKLDWDPRLTLQQNYRKMGLVCDPNASALEEIKREKAKLLSLNGICLHESDEGEELPQGREESRVVQLLKEIANEPPAPPRIQTSLAIWEQVELQKLVAKHGEDYEAMARDMKLNKYQRNANQLRKRVALFHHLQNL